MSRKSQISQSWDGEIHSSANNSLGAAQRKEVVDILDVAAKRPNGRRNGRTITEPAQRLKQRHAVDGPLMIPLTFVQRVREHQWCHAEVRIEPRVTAYVASFQRCNANEPGLDARQSVC